MPLTLDRPYDSLLAQFEQEEAIATPYKDDTSLLPQKEVEGRLDKLEAKATNLLSQAINRAGWEYAGRARKAK